MSHDTFMRLALEEARKAHEAGEVPIGAVLLLDGEVIGTGFNRPISAHDPTAHAEIAALRAAAARVGNYRLTGATLYVTVEPCLMCVGAMVHARVGLSCMGQTEPKAGAVLSMTRAHELPALNHRLQVLGGVLEAECRELIQGLRQSRGQHDEGSDYRWKPGYRGGDRGARASSRPSSGVYRTPTGGHRRSGEEGRCARDQS